MGMLTSQDVTCHMRIRLVQQKRKLYNASLNPLINSSLSHQMFQEKAFSSLVATLFICREKGMVFWSV